MDYRAEYQKWLTEFVGDKATIDELKSLEGDEREIEDRFYTELEFGTAGMRGVIGAGLNRMNAYNVRRATLGLADYINQNPEHAGRCVVIAYDSRRFSPEFAEQAALVLCAQGIKTCLFESLRPVPVLSFAVRYLGAISGIVITASHNPPQYNGYKVYWEDGGQMPPERAGEVLKCIRARDFKEAVAMNREEAPPIASFIPVPKKKPTISSGARPPSSARSVAKAEGKDAQKKRDRWQRIAMEAAKQCGRSLVPEVEMPMNFAKALEDMRARELMLMPYELHRGRGLNSIEPYARDIGILIGPEGGIDAAEAEKAETAGALPVTLGPRILRTETAAIATIAMTMLRFGDTGGDI